jgi:poly(beta-D-mannuronate) lyase
MADEKDNKGYYNAEKIVFTQNTVNKQAGILFNVYRGGNDESTMGPKLVFTKNSFRNCNTTDTSVALIQLTGVQQSDISSNQFIDCNESGGATGKLIHYIDFVRAHHTLQKNSFVHSGSVQANKFVTTDNTSQSIYQKDPAAPQSK